MPNTAPASYLFEIGRRLAPLREEGVWILASGNLVHNLRRVDFTGQSGPPSWAREFDDWIGRTIAARDWDSLVDYASRAPALHLAHPTEEHLRPLLVAAGAGADDPVQFVLEGWEFGSISRRSVQFG
jgi:4,5-DOPA dioxygenase extradiol